MCFEVDADGDFKLVEFLARSELLRNYGQQRTTSQVKISPSQFLCGPSTSINSESKSCWSVVRPLSRVIFLHR